jgi:hypothetical protein
MSQARGQLRTIEPVEPDGPDEAGRGRRRDVLKCTYRPPDANFFCWKYGVWYNLLDCCYRHFRQTYSGCAGCGQGASNLKVNKDRFHSIGHLGERSRIGR